MRLSTSSILVAFTAFPLVLGGCLSHKTIEPIEGASPLADNPNDAPVPEALATGLGWVVTRYPPFGETFLGRGPEQPFAINFPVGVRRDVANRICRLTSKNAQPLSEENQNLPTYHIGRLWIRGDLATVDIFAPVAQYTPASSATGASAGTVYQMITMKLRTRGLEPYYVQSHNVFPIGSFPTPELRFMSPGEDGRAGGINSFQARPKPVKATTAADPEILPDDYFVVPPNKPTGEIEVLDDTVR